MKKFIISIIIAIIIAVNSNLIVYAKNESSTTDDSATSSWVSDAFSAAKNFIEEQPTETFGFESDILELFKSIIQGINYVLLILLAGLSIISLSLVGVRYLLSGASPNQKETAKKSLHTVFIGMAYGFGAFVIWNIAMQIIKLIINAFVAG